MFKVFVQASTGRFYAEFSKGEDVMSMVRMVASGAQVSQGWGINISSDNGEVTANGRTIHGMVDAVSRVLSALEDMPARVRQPGEAASSQSSLRSTASSSARARGLPARIDGIAVWPASLRRQPCGVVSGSGSPRRSAAGSAVASTSPCGTCR